LRIRLRLEKIKRKEGGKGKEKGEQTGEWGR
jgi:hypothetical protein